MKACGKVIVHLIFISKTKNYKSEPYYKKHSDEAHRSSLKFHIKTLQLCSNYQGTLIKPQEFIMASYIQKVLNQRLGFLISFRVKPNT